MSRALKYVEQAGTGHHHHLTLSSELNNPLWQEVSLKRSGSDAAYGAAYDAARTSVVGSDEATDEGSL